MAEKLNILVWNEGVHELNNEPATIGEMYPTGMHGAIAESLREYYPDANITTATLADPEHGLSEETLAATDVVLWWGHHCPRRRLRRSGGARAAPRAGRHGAGGPALGPLCQDLHRGCWAPPAR